MPGYESGPWIWNVTVHRRNRLAWVLTVHEREPGFWLKRPYASLHGELMKPEITETERRCRVRLSILNPAFYLLGTLCSVVLPTLDICIYAALPAHFAIANLAGGIRDQPEE